MKNIFKRYYFWIIILSFDYNLISHAATITGRVWKDAYEEPYAHARVQLIDLNRSVESDDKGYYLILDVPTGRHFLEVWYCELRKRDTIMISKEDQIIHHDIYAHVGLIKILPTNESETYHQKISETQKGNKPFEMYLYGLYYGINGKIAVDVRIHNYAAVPLYLFRQKECKHENFKIIIQNRKGDTIRVPVIMDRCDVLGPPYYDSTALLTIPAYPNQVQYEGIHLYDYDFTDFEFDLYTIKVVYEYELVKYARDNTPQKMIDQYLMACRTKIISSNALSFYNYPIRPMQKK